MPESSIVQRHPRTLPPLLLAAALVAALVPTIGTAAEPEGGTIRWDETVHWSGGPLSAPNNIFTSSLGIVAGRCAQDQGLCDEFLLDVQVQPSPSPTRTRFVDVEVKASKPGALMFFVIPPRGDPSRDRLLHRQGAARLSDPDRGVWRPTPTSPGTAT